MEQILSRMVAEGLLDESAATRVRASLAEGKPLEEAVLSADGVSEERLLRFLATTFDVPYVDVEKSPVTREFLARKLREYDALRHEIQRLQAEADQEARG